MLSPILSTLYLSPLFHIFEKRTKNLKIPISFPFLLFVDNGLFISQKNLLKNPTLFSIIVIFIFDKKLTFYCHIKHYANKAILTIKCMKMLSNSTRSLFLIQKYALYRMCILPIVLYGFSMWYYNKALLLFPLKELNKIQ